MHQRDNAGRRAAWLQLSPGGQTIFLKSSSSRLEVGGRGKDERSSRPLIFIWRGNTTNILTSAHKITAEVLKKKQRVAVNPNANANSTSTTWMFPANPTIGALI
jgi:hypothetical protein